MRPNGVRLHAVIMTCLVACGGVGEVTATTTSSTTTGEQTVPTTGPVDGEFAAVVERSRADLATRLLVEESSIGVAEAELVTWRDGSLGCPQPGMVYTQALVEGTRVVLSHGDRFYDYHAGTDNQPFLCESEAEDGGHDSIPRLEGATSA